MIWLALGIMMVSLATAYGWWVVLRTTLLRQDILDLRDGLFDKAREMDVLDDPAHRRARDHLNMIAGNADWMTIPIIAFVLHRGFDKPGFSPLPQSDNPEFQRAIDSALEQSAHMLARHLLRRTFTGVVIVPLASLVRLGRELESQTESWLQQLIMSDAPQQIAAVGRAAYPRVV